MGQAFETEALTACGRAARARHIVGQFSARQKIPTFNASSYHMCEYFKGILQVCDVIRIDTANAGL